MGGVSTTDTSSQYKLLYGRTKLCSRNKTHLRGKLGRLFSASDAVFHLKAKVSNNGSQTHFETFRDSDGGLRSWISC